jgi:membrane protein
VNRAWHTIEIPWWQLPLKNLAMVAVIGGGLLMGILFPALVQVVIKVLTTLEAVLVHYVPIGQRSDWFLLLDASRYVIGGVVLFYTFAMLYMLAPRCTVRFRQVWLSALCVTVILQAVQIAFVNYLPIIVNYNVVYGSVGGLMLLLLWIYTSGMVIIGGACFCAAISRVDEPASPATPSSSEN